MTGPTRRAVLRAGALAVATSIAGCAGTDSGTETQSERGESATADSPTSSPSPAADCTPDLRPQPTPTAEGLQPRSYPTYPETITESSARQFAEEFEVAYQVNRFLAENFIEGTDEITVTGGAPDWAVRESDRGVLVGVNGTLRTADTETPTNSTGTQAPYLDAPFSAWYELRPSRARRVEVDELSEDDDPEFSDAMVVACAE